MADIYRLNEEVGKYEKWVDIGTDPITGNTVYARAVAADIVVGDTIAVTGPLTNTEIRATALPVSGPLTDTQIRATALPVSGPLTDTQIRATALPVSGPLTDTQIRATALPVSGPLTDTQIRATALPVSGPLTDTQIRATALPVSGPLTDTQIRATALPVSGPLTDTQIRATALPVSGPLTDTQIRATALPVASTLTASELHIGQVGGEGITISQTPTISAAAIYAAGDAVGGLLTFANAARVSGGGGVIKNMIIIDDDKETGALELWLFKATFTPTADNAAFTVSDADLENCIGVISTANGDWFAAANNQVADVETSKRYDLTGTSMFGQLVTRGTQTYTATTDITVKVALLRD